MSKFKSALRKIDHVLVMVDRALFGQELTVNHTFTVTQPTMNKITGFLNSHPEITKQFVDREVNAALSDLVERMERELEGNC